MQFNLREHHQYDKNDVMGFEDISSDGTGSGALQAWLPKRTQMVEQQGCLHIHNPKVNQSHTYQTYDTTRAALNKEWPANDGQSPYDGGVWDIVLTAKTEDDFAAVWGCDRYHGRVRSWDGLVVLVRKMRHESGCWVFRGYVHNNQNLVGRWRETGTSVSSPGLEGVWSMVKSSSL
ncbi:hypothetical protein K439DRAFT_1633965 [Ramaria rubella]|nr:hypothetical protein K439DRAFT_1633965 [Ramaria rubella]